MTVMPPLPRVVQLSFFNDPAGRRPATLLQAWPTLVDVAEAVAAADVEVSVIQASVHTEELTRNSVSYHFLPFGDALPRGSGSGLGDLLRRLKPAVLHVHGLGFPHHVIALSEIAPGIPIVLQDHANRPPRPWRRALWRRAIARAAAVTFCAAEQAKPFVSAHLIDATMPCLAIPESSSRFTPGDPGQARQITGLHGDPALLWVGHLDSNKDPLTILEGVRRATGSLPRLQLWCCFGTEPLGKEVRQRVARDPLLRDRVHLVGNVPHERVEQFMRAADVFVQGSHHESTGYSVIEALACGLPPVITDIPSFRALTGGGKVGALWPPEDAAALAAALQSVASCAAPALRSSVRQHFERELSLAALGSKLAALYERVAALQGAAADGGVQHRSIDAHAIAAARGGEASCRQ